MPTHEIFKKPFKVEPTYTDYPTPKNYLASYLGRNMGQTMKVWRVQKKGYLKDKGTPPGMVAFGEGFDDTPDAEAMARGINTKTPAHVSIGRHANFLLWGFSASPTGMTEEGRKVFLNCVCYIKEFEGERPLLIDKRDTLFGVRSYALAMAYRVTDPKSHEGGMVAYYERSMKRSLAPELRARFGYDKKKWLDYFQQNIDYVRPRSPHGQAPDGRRDLSFVVDEDAKKLGIRTGDPKMLETCVKILEGGGDKAMARRLLTRYTSEKFETAKLWRKWLDTNRDRIYFTERSGFQFFVDPRPRARRSAPQDAKARSDGRKL